MMMNRLRIFNTPGRFRLTKDWQLLPTTPLLPYLPRNKYFNTYKPFLANQPSTRCIHTAEDSFEADKLCSVFGVQHLAKKGTAQSNETLPGPSEPSHQAAGEQGRVASAGKGQRGSKNGNETQEQRRCQRLGQQQDKLQRQQQQPQDGLKAQIQQTVDQMDHNHFGYQPGYPPIWQGEFVQQQQQQQQYQYQNQQHYPRQEQYGMGYAPPPNMGYGFIPPTHLNTFAPGTTIPHWQQPLPPFYSGAGTRSYHTNTNNNNNNNNNRPQVPQPAGCYRSRSPGPYSRVRQYSNSNNNNTYTNNTHPDFYRPRSPGPYSRGGRRGQYNNNNNNNINNHHSQQQQIPPTSRPSHPPKLNKKAKAREAAAREALAQAQAQRTTTTMMMPASSSFIPPQGGGTPREGRDPIVPPSRASGGIPEPSHAYKIRASFLAREVPQPRPILVVIDLNGTLLHRPSRKRPSKFVERPFARDFLKYCIDTFKVVIWSSARPQNVEMMCQQLLTEEQLGKVVAIWARDKFGLTQADFNTRVQCYKRLTMLWEDPTVAASNPEGEPWNQGNTVLIDDSAEKARSEPYNCITLPEFVGDLNEKPEVLPMVREYLNILAHQADISTYIRVKPFNISEDSSGAVTGHEGVALASTPAAAQ
ncbi:hypothetical protein GE21DRAFT_7401 [Neurospora crassa]|uniref:FCP1 homology domain-containing protein n=2 Tax=Neurospora crassa TaxID=5141 RepID=Q7S7R8_NEUCR|nr:hypothetical protein NCU03825 [Neurospora crassa OR74A]EAA31978.1 hypothetical protein NCU03825 [Neurospora crassa OR74A]KHE88107.1 hypothetical protein GE21DRAFT_7401 [Neurospora crassa]CAE76103.1 conserved hypothetical protein [Neurospora crassa]|eukprot:XP_961214.1 hypothetical protein NCU03825 [Neurospora crassa OR74A]